MSEALPPSPFQAYAPPMAAPPPAEGNPPPSPSGSYADEPKQDAAPPPKSKADELQGLIDEHLPLVMGEPVDSLAFRVRALFKAVVDKL